MQGTTATIREQSLVGVASRYIDVSPGPSFEPKLPNDAVLPASKTSGIVDIDELFDALNANTRAGLRRLIAGFAEWYAGKSTQANLSAQYFPPALQSYATLFSQIDASTPTLNEFIDQTSSALGAIDARSAQLTDLVSQSRVTADALSSEDQALTQALTNLPGALTEGSATFERLRNSTLPALEQLVNATRPVTGPLRPFLSQLQPVLNEAVPTVSLLRQILDKPGPNNDLLDALHDLPALGKAVSRRLPAGDQGAPAVDPDLRVRPALHPRSGRLGRGLGRRVRALRRQRPLCPDRPGVRRVQLPGQRRGRNADGKAAEPARLGRGAEERVPVSLPGRRDHPAAGRVGAVRRLRSRSRILTAGRRRRSAVRNEAGADPGRAVADPRCRARDRPRGGQRNERVRTATSCAPCSTTPRS